MIPHLNSAPVHSASRANRPGGNLAIMEVFYMKQLLKSVLTFVLILALTAGLCAGSMAASASRLESAVEASAGYMLNTVTAPQVGSIGGEWAVIGLSRSGCGVPQSYWDNYYATVVETVKACDGVLHAKKYTDYSRVILALTSIGADPTDVGGYNLLVPLGDFEKTIWQGINGPVWALIALDSGNYDIPSNPSAKTQATRQLYIDEILSRQLSDGGWNLTDKGGDERADPDITGMALQALANYQNQTAVKSAVDKALTCLSGMQTADGGYSSWGTVNSESTVQVIVALCALGIPLDDSRFVKNGSTLLDNLLSYRQSDGSFKHTADGSGSNQMASEQGFYGIVAALRAARGENSLYHMNDVAITVSGKTGGTGLAGKHADVKKRPITLPGATFSDISGENAHANQAAIEALASREIINGKDGGLFDPNADMTRAEFATIVVKALGLTPKAGGAFSDVSSGDWFAAYVGTAASYGIVNGVGDGSFNSLGTITRQEAATMVARAAKLCGMDTALSAAAVRDTLAQFGDYITVPAWAQGSLAFCYSCGILDDSALNIEPFKPVLRCEIAQMLYHMLSKSNLL